MNIDHHIRKNSSAGTLIKYLILSYWSLFWLFNSLDKLIGGSQFLWVGRDRFAQFQKFFASIGVESPTTANLSLVVVGGLEIFAFLFFAGALVYFIKKNRVTARSWFFVGIILTLIIFTIFAVGDHIFGDRFELLEHTLFWFITLFSWVVFNRLDTADSGEETPLEKGKLLPVMVIVVMLVVATTISIFKYNQNHFKERTQAVHAERAGTDLYKFSFPFLGGSTAFERTVSKFKADHPSKRIVEIYTVPKELRLKKADGLVFFIITEDKE